MTTDIPAPPRAPAGHYARFRGMHYLTDQVYEASDLLELLDLAEVLKALWRRRPLTPFLAGRTLAMIFEHPSTRTRVSFEAGMTELGGHAQYLRPGEIHLGGHESVKDTALAISQLADAIMARTAFHSTLMELGRWATVPVINGLTDDYDHPIQSLTDALTIKERLGRVDGLTVAFLGKCSDAMCTSVALTMTRLGSSMVLAAPPGEQMAPETQGLVRANCEQAGGALTLTDDPIAAVREADIVYTVGWWWQHTEEEKERYRRLFMPYQVNEALWGQTKPDALFMHCLPAVRGEEVTDAVMDGDASVVWQEAGNRKHLQKAVLLALIGVDDLPADPDLQPIGRALLS